MRKTWAMLALAGACAMATGAARADVIYTFTQTGGTSLPAYRVDGTLDITDAAVQSGSFDLKGQAGPVSYSGDAADFISFQIPGIDATATPPTLGSSDATFQLAFNFDKSGNITSDAITWFGPSDGGTLSGDESLSTGTAASDNPVCGSDGSGGPCGTVIGSWAHTAFTPGAAVPEPATFAVLGAGLIGLAAARRRANGSASLN